MLSREFLKGKKADVIGLGISNIALIKFLLKYGCKVTARDKKEDIEQAGFLKESGVKLVLGDDYLSGLDGDIIFRSPGIRYDKDEISRAVEKGSILSSETELFLDLCPAYTIGITGSDGKTTTSTLISLLLKESGKKVYLGGNIGNPLIGCVDEMSKYDFAVCELSSFQLHTMQKSPCTAVVTNISPNHLDYHTSYEEYIGAKENIFLNEGNFRVILNGSNKYTLSMAEKCKDKEVLLFNSPEGFYKDEKSVYFKGEKILDKADILVVGEHNVENYMTAAAATWPWINKETLAKVAKSFKGVEHRIEFVSEVNGVKYYNSSIDSSPSRTIAALNSFKDKVIVICGGYDKKVPFDSLGECFSRKAKKVILTGATADKIEKAINDYPGEKPELFKEYDFDKAVLLAAKNAQEGDTVILSPACASFDSFKNFEQRGKRFKELVSKL